MTPFFINIIEYNFWADEELRKTLFNSSSIYGDILKTYCHILNAEETWYSRVSGDPAPEQGLWDVYPASRFESVIVAGKKNWVQLINDRGEQGLSEEITYSNSKGVSYTQSLADIIFHMVNHGSYHRGQITRMLKQKNISLPVLDYIFYERSKEIKAETDKSKTDKQ